MSRKAEAETIKQVGELGERVRASEVRIEGLHERMDKFEIYCKETQEIYRESFADMNARIEKFMTNEIHDLQDRIKVAAETKRQPLSNSDWAKILITIVTVVGSIIVALAQYGAF